MALNPTGTTNTNWNFSNNQKDNYSESLVGTVVSIQEIQAVDFYGGNRTPKFWPDGNPIMNIRMGFALEDGSLKTFTFAKAGKEQRAGNKPSVHMQMFNLTGDMMNLLGKTLSIVTWPVNPQTGQAWGKGNPRLFSIELVEDKKFTLTNPLPHELTIPELLADNGASGGQPAAQPQPQPQYVAQPIIVPQQPAHPQPMYQPTVTMQQQQQNPVVQQAQPLMHQQPTGVINPMQPAMPAGMDPNVAAAMQAVGATNVQPVTPYDDEIPF